MRASLHDVDSSWKNSGESARRVKVRTIQGEVHTCHMFGSLHFCSILTVLVLTVLVSTNWKFAHQNAFVVT